MLQFDTSNTTFALEEITELIFESWPWRDDLLRDVEVLRRWKDKPPSGRREFIIEKKVFTSAYVMRKLMESFKLSSDQPSHHVRCKTYKSVKPITWYDRWDFDEHYDLESPSRTSISISGLYNLIIHSFLFVENVDERDERFTGFLVTSDHQRDEALWDIDIEDYLALMKRIAEDDPTNVQMRFNKVKGEWVTWRGHGDPPPEFEGRT